MKNIKLALFQWRGRLVELERYHSKSCTTLPVAAGLMSVWGLKWVETWGGMWLPQLCWG